VVVAGRAAVAMPVAAGAMRAVSSARRVQDFFITKTDVRLEDEKALISKLLS
jgi:hypothetical protein